MNKKILLIVVYIIFCISGIFSQTDISNDYLNPTIIKISQDADYELFFYDHSTGNDFPLDDNINRMYPGASSYFSFQVPKTGEATIKFSFPKETLFIIAFYIEDNEGNYILIKHKAFNDFQADFNIYNFDNLAKEDVLARFWMLGEPSSGEFGLCIISEPLGTDSKVISISTTTYNPEELVHDILLAGCVKAYNVQYTGHTDAIGYFWNAIPPLNFEDGVILSTGRVTDAAGPNSGNASTNLYQPGDDDLAAIVNANTLDAAVLEFDFRPASDELSFNYVFASDEYHTFATSSYNDVFAFLISGGPENYDKDNIALLPGTTTVVSINTVNNGNTNTGPCMNCQYFVANESGNPYIRYDGMTVTLTAIADVTACEIYQMKLAIADVQDGSWDSAVFLEAGSFTAGEIYEISSYSALGDVSYVMQGCTHYIVFTRTENVDFAQPFTITINTGGTAVMGTDYTPIPAQIVIPAFQLSYTIAIDALITGNPNAETIILYTNPGCPCDDDEMIYIVTIEPLFDINPQLSNNGPICAGESADLQLVLNSQDDSLVSVEWSTGDTNVNNIQVTPNQTSIYSVTVTYPCDEIVLSTEVVVVALPVVDLGADLAIPGLNATLNSNMDPNNTGVWTVIDGPGNALIDNPASPSINIEVDQYGYYTFQWTETSLAPNCVASGTIVIHFYHILIVDFETTPVPCIGDYTTVTFTGSTAGFGDFNWDFGNGTIISGEEEGPYEILFETSGDNMICLTVIEGILEETHCANVYVPPLLEGEMIIEDDPCYQSCQGKAKIEVTGGTPGYTYSWASSSNEISYLCIGEHSITVTDANGCIISENFFIDQPEALVYDTAYNDINCYGDPAGNAEIIVSGGTPSYSYLWNDGHSESEYNNIYAGTYQVTVTDDNGCTVSTQFVITQPNSPLLLSTSGNRSICEHQTITISAYEIGGTPPYTYYWDNGGGSGFTEGPQSFDITPNEDITYSVYVIDGKDCVSPTEEIEIIVSPEMILNLTTKDDPCYQTCNGSASVTVTGGLQPFSYSWGTGTPNLYNLCNGLYTLTVTDKIGCYADTIFVINQPTKLTMQLTTGNATCHDSPDGIAAATVQGGTPPYNYIWSNNVQGNPLVALPGTYNITVSDSNNCKIYGTTTINSPQELKISPLSNHEICIGGEATIIGQATGGTSPYTFHWEGTDGSVYDKHTFKVSPELSTDYYVTVTDAKGCVTSGSRAKVFVFPPIEIKKINVDTNPICEGDGTIIELVISGGNGGPYQITINNDSIVSAPFIYSPKETTNLIITVSDLCETPAVKDSVMVYVRPLPIVSFTSNKYEGCRNLKVHFTQTNAGESGDSYLWQFGNNKYSKNQNPSHIYDKSGKYDVTLTIRDQYNCENSLTIKNMIEVWPKPIANFIMEPEYASILNPKIKFTSLSEDELYTYWFYGDGDSTINFTSPEHFYKNIGEYQPILIVENEFGCTDTATRTVHIHDEFTLYAPTAFSPNGDGINDCFRVCGQGIDPNSFYMVIYDRLGIIVREVEKFDINAGCDECADDSWDGTTGSREKGDEYLPTGLYFWYVTFDDLYGTGHEFSGKVVLLR